MLATESRGTRFSARHVLVAGPGADDEDSGACA